MVFSPLPNASTIHSLLETLAFFAGYQVYRYQRGAVADHISTDHRNFLVLAAALGALVGSRIPGLLEPNDLIAIGIVRTGRTIVGGLLGGWIAVDSMRKLLGIKSASGDLYVDPIIVGLCVGRIGCFLSGLSDLTYGMATTLPWAVDFGDGVPRHPTQLYEIFFLLTFRYSLKLRFPIPGPKGRKFKAFIIGYLIFRFFIDFLKPLYPLKYVELSPTQVTAILGLSYFLACTYAGKFSDWLRRAKGIDLNSVSTLCSGDSTGQNQGMSGKKYECDEGLHVL